MDLFKNNVVLGVGAAFAATMLAPILVPALGRTGRPLLKSVVKGAMHIVDKGRETLAVAGESVEDLMAEIRAERSAWDAPAPPPQSVPVGEPDLEAR